MAILDRAVHPFGLAIGPRMIGLGQSVLDAIGEADAVKMCARVITACEWRSASEPAPVEESRLDLVAGRLYLCCQQGYDQSCRPMLRRKSPKNRLIGGCQKFRV